MEATQRQEISDVDVVIIGAGPHALCLVSKLLEPHIEQLEELPENRNIFRIKQTHCSTSGDNVETKDPADQTRDEKCHTSATATRSLDPSAAPAKVTCLHPGFPPARLLLSKARVRQAASTARSSSARHASLLEHFAVLDPHGTWMWQWRAQFDALRITQLRSATNAHPDPVDTQNLRLYAEEKGRRQEFKQIELDRTQIYNGPFEVPSTKIFNQFCDDVVQRYHLQDAVTAADVTAIRVDPVGSPATTPHNSDDSCSTQSRTRVTVQYQCQRTKETRAIQAGAVVVAVGSLSVPRYPDWVDDCSCRNTGPRNHFLHSTDILKQPSIIDDVNDTSVLIVGGGLTAGHLAVRACRAGNRVHLVSRSSINLKQFDLDLEWMSNQRNLNIAKFWSLSLEQRLETLRKVKGGGSITPEVWAALEPFRDQGLFEVTEECEVTAAVWDDDEDSWYINLTDGTDLHAAHVWCATGTIVDVKHHPLLSSLAQSHPIHTFNGFPVLTPDLAWRHDVPVFVMGELAALELGPGAVNLMGGRAGAARVARAIRQRFPDVFGGACSTGTAQ